MPEGRETESLRQRRTGENRTKEPSDLASDEFHPQDEDAQAAIPRPVEAPEVAVETGPAEVAEAEAKAVRAAGIRTNPTVVEWNPFTHALEVGEDEAGVESGAPKTAQVMLRQIEPHTNLAEQDELFGVGLAGRTRRQARNPERQAVLGRLIDEVPALLLQVGELLVAGAGLRSVGLQREAGLDQPCHRAEVGHLGRELAVLGDERLGALRQVLLAVNEPLDGFLVGEGREVGARADVGGEFGYESLELVRTIDDRQLFLIAKVADHT